IDVCETSDQGISSAIVNTNVPLSVVFPYFYASSANEMICYDPTTGAPLDPSDPLCQGALAELGDDGAAGYEDLPSTPVELGTGELQVPLTWQSGDDQDLLVTDPSNSIASWKSQTVASGGIP